MNIKKGQFSSLSSEVGRFLQERIRTHGREAVIFYGDVASHFNLEPITNAWPEHPLCKIFEKLDLEDFQFRRPLRTTIVISKDQNMPGGGFFKMFLKLNPNVRAPITELEKMKLYLEELNKLVEFWSKAK